MAWAGVDTIAEWAVLGVLAIAALAALGLCASVLVSHWRHYDDRYPTYPYWMDR